MGGSPPLRVTVCRGKENDDLLVVLDHVAADARGMFVVLSLIADAYAGRELLVPGQPEDEPGLDLRCPFLSNVGVIPPSAGAFGADVTFSAVWIVTDFVSGRYPSLAAGTWNGSLHLAAAAASGDTSVDRIFDLMISSLFSLSGPDARYFSD